MAYTICLQNAMASLNVDSYNRVAIAGADLSNGSVVALLTQGNVANPLYNEVWNAYLPLATSKHLWLVRSPEVTVDNHGYVSGDMREFYNPANKPFDAKLMVYGDIFTVTAEGITGTQGTNEFVVADPSNAKLKWASAAPADGAFAAKLLGATTIPGYPSIPAFKFEVVQN